MVNKVNLKILQCLVRVKQNVMKYPITIDRWLANCSCQCFSVLGQ